MDRKRVEKLAYRYGVRAEKAYLNYQDSTAAETISMSDVENTAKLIADYVRKAVK